MLILDMADLSVVPPEHLVAHHCSYFGRPTIIHLLPPDSRREYGIVAVKMPTLAEAMNVAREFGDAQCGSIVLIRLARQAKTKSVPSSSMRESLQVPSPSMA